MARLSINEMTTYRWSFEEDVRHYRAAQIGAIGVWRQKLSDFGEDKAVELLADSGLEVSNLFWAGGFTGSDGHSYRESLKDAADAIRLASTLGADCLLIYSGARNGHTQNHARRLFIGALRELLPIAFEHEVVLAIEPMHAGCSAEWTFLNGLGDTLDLLEAVNDDHLKIAFDTYHLGHDARVLDSIALLVERIAIVHLGDSKKPPDTEQHRHRLGEGILPLKQIVAALIDGGYRGYFDLELVGEEIESSNYCELLQASKRAFDQLVGAVSKVES